MAAAQARVKVSGLDWEVEDHAQAEGVGHQVEGRADLVERVEDARGAGDVKRRAPEDKAGQDDIDHDQGQPCQSKPERRDGSVQAYRQGIGTTLKPGCWIDKQRLAETPGRSA